MARTTRSKGKLEAQQAIEHLRVLLPPGTTVHTVLRHVARSGMQRRIDVYLLRDQEDVYLSGYVAKALGMRRHASKEGLVVNGCGMDMGFHIVHELALTQTDSIALARWNGRTDQIPAARPTITAMAIATTNRTTTSTVGTRSGTSGFNSTINNRKSPLDHGQRAVAEGEMGGSWNGP